MSTIFGALLFVYISLMPLTSGYADFSVPSVSLFTHANYDYAPSVIQEGNIQKFWWCGFDGTDVIYHRSIDLSTQTWSSIQIVLRPTTKTWDRQFTCDPSVIAGSFVDPATGKKYSLAMYYTATDRPDGTNNRIGVAFSNDGINWVKYKDPIISPKAFPTAGYGAGQAATYNRDGGAGLILFHTDTSAQESNRMYIRTTEDGIHFSDPIPVPFEGMRVSGFMANSDFAYDYANGYFYAALESASRAGDRETYEIGLYRMKASALLSGIGTWEDLGYVNTNLTGFYLNHSPGFLRDKFGNVTRWFPDIEIYFAAGTNDPSTWDLNWVIWRGNSFPTLPFRRYFNSANGHHWVTTGNIGPGDIAPGYDFESTLGYLFRSGSVSRDTQPLYGCELAADHFISLSPDCEGARLDGVNGWIYKSQAPNTTALYRCIVTDSGDHFVSGDPNCEGEKTEALLGYAFNTPGSPP